MLDRIIELLLGLAVAAASAFGIGTATTTPQGPPTDHGQTGKPDAVATQAAENGLNTALSAIERAMDTADDAATDGLQRAWDQVSTAGEARPEDAGRPEGAGAPEDPGGAADDHAPVDVPAGPR